MLVCLGPRLDTALASQVDLEGRTGIPYNVAI